MAQSLFDALRAAIKTKQPITNKSIKARMEVNKLFGKPITSTMDTEKNVAAIQAKLAIIKAKAEWQNVALAIHVLHTTCRTCSHHTECTEDLLLKQYRKRDGVFRYVPIKTPEGFSELQYITLCRQVTIPMCHRCVTTSETLFQSDDKRQLSLPLNIPLENTIKAKINVAA